MYKKKYTQNHFISGIIALCYCPIVYVWGDEVLLCLAEQRRANV